MKFKKNLKKTHLHKLGRKDSNLRISVPKTAALPLGDVPFHPKIFLKKKSVCCFLKNSDMIFFLFKQTFGLKKIYHFFLFSSTLKAFFLLKKRKRQNSSFDAFFINFFIFFVSTFFFLKKNALSISNLLRFSKKLTPFQNF